MNIHTLVVLLYNPILLITESTYIGACAMAGNLYIQQLVHALNTTLFSTAVLFATYSLCTSCIYNSYYNYVTWTWTRTMCLELIHTPSALSCSCRGRALVPSSSYGCSPSTPSAPAGPHIPVPLCGLHASTK